MASIVSSAPRSPGRLGGAGRGGGGRVGAVQGGGRVRGGGALVRVGRSRAPLHPNVIVHYSVAGVTVRAGGRPVVLVTEAEGRGARLALGAHYGAGGGGRRGAAAWPCYCVIGDGPAGGPGLLEGELGGGLRHLVVVRGGGGVAGTQEGLEAAQVTQHLKHGQVRAGSEQHWAATNSNNGGEGGLILSGTPFLKMAHFYSHATMMR